MTNKELERELRKKLRRSGRLEDLKSEEKSRPKTKAEIEEELRKQFEVQEQLKRMKNEKGSILPTVMLLGGTGCGKSTLVNTVFRKKRAVVSDVSRGTEQFWYYDGQESGLGINLVDSQGYELGDESGLLKYLYDLNHYLENGKRNPAKRVHLIWYCISIAGERVQDYDVKVLNYLRQMDEVKGHIAVVLTKCDLDKADGSNAKKFKSILRNEVFQGLDFFEISNDPELALDLDKLTEWSAESLRELDIDGDLEEAFIRATKRKDALYDHALGRIIIPSAAVSGAIGASPIPFSDVFLLVPGQIVMCSEIAKLYGLAPYYGVVSSITSEVIVSSMGKLTAGNLTKLVPGAGSVINAGVAAVLTIALGIGVSTLCRKALTLLQEGDDVDMAQVFTAENLSQAIADALPEAKRLAEEKIRH